MGRLKCTQDFVKLVGVESNWKLNYRISCVAVIFKWNSLLMSGKLKGDHFAQAGLFAIYF